MTKILKAGGGLQPLFGRVVDLSIGQRQVEVNQTQWLLNSSGNAIEGWGPDISMSPQTQYTSPAMVSTGLTGAGHVVLIGATWYSITALPGFAVAQGGPSNPASTVSTSLVMMGLKFGVTPAVSGNLKVVLTLLAGTATAVAQMGFTPKWGTGTGPNNGDAVTGTTWGPNWGTAAGVVAPGIGQFGQFVFPGKIATATIGSPVWIDMAFATSAGADALTAKFVTSLIEECK